MSKGMYICKISLGAMLILLTGITQLQAQPDTLWTRTYGGVGYESGSRAVECSSGGFLIIGYTETFGNGGRDIYLIRTDENGDTLWTRTYGGAHLEEGVSVAECSSGGFIISAITTSYGPGGRSAYILRLDDAGDTIWTRVFGPIGYEGPWITEISSGGFLIAAAHPVNYNLEGWIIRIDENGDTLWTKTYGGSGTDYFLRAIEVSDGGFLLGGYTNSFGAGGYDAWLVRTDESGNTVWEKTYGGADDDFGVAAIECTSGGFLLSGWTRSFGAGNSDMYIVRIDENGDTLWTRSYGGVDLDRGFSAIESRFGGFLAVGSTKSFGAGEQDIWLVKIDSNGDTLWTKTYGGANIDGGLSIIECSSGGYLIAGHTNSFGMGDFDVWILRIEPEVIVSEENELGYPQIHVYTNPAKGAVVFQNLTGYVNDRTTLTIYDATGRPVYKINLSTQVDKFLWYGTDKHGNYLPSGTYFYRIEGQDYSKSGKFLFLR